MPDTPEDSMKAKAGPPPADTPVPEGEDCELCEVTCGILGLEGGSKAECKALFKQVGADEITNEAFQAKMDEKYGPGWDEKVFNVLNKSETQQGTPEE